MPSVPAAYMLLAHRWKSCGTVSTARAPNLVAAYRRRDVEKAYTRRQWCIIWIQDGVDQTAFMIGQHSLNSPERKDDLLAKSKQSKWPVFTAGRFALAEL